MPALSRLNKWTSNRTRGGFFEMPCFENAAEIILNLGFLRVQMPSGGVFVQLTVLVLERVWFCRPCNLGAAVSSPRCPRLQVLRVCNTRGLFSLDINSESLLELELNNIVALYSHSIEAAVLKKLTVMNCFCRIDKNFATISAPQLVFLSWGNPLGQQKFLSLGQMPHLQSIGEFSYLVYTDQSSKIVYTDQGPIGIPDNSAFMELLQRFKFKAIESLALALIYTSDLENCQYMMEDMKVFPDPAILYLSVLAHGHSFGASSFHVFRRCLGIKRLVLVLLDNAVSSEAQTDDPCPPDCVCDEQNNWKTEELLLINLQEIEIQLLGGFEHEVSFVKRLLNWATALNKVTVTLSSSTTENDAKELFQMFKSLSKPEVCIKLMYHNHKEVLYAT
ncbi:hypothetical protein SORBI_3002G016000 [Sorghum bicolor]|uniref:FBD domain-containing protein n=2 Tax=Sorghum bicolor TaxID=4558 RepID=A0A1B6Q8R3_SORBI|nr:hypothetical protein SORBI_3002G016000 [Sorghum bicolor]